MEKYLLFLFYIWQNNQNLFHIILSDSLNNIKAAIKWEGLKAIFLILNSIC